MPMEAPTWSRVLYRFSRALSAVDVSQQILRDELLLAFVPPDQRSGVTFDVYSKNIEYVPGGGFYAKGLFPWELAMLDDSRVPRAGRVLLAAAGGGRELRALVARGFEVCAFEPAEPLFESSRNVARGSSAVALKASYQDLVSWAEGRGGPLSGWRGPFDLCLLGWGSISHLTAPGAALEVFRALRTLAPRTPVITSFLMRGATPPATAGGARKLRGLVRRALQAVGGYPVHQGLGFSNSSGFIHSYSKEELFELWEQAGYSVAHFSDRDYPHALLLPSEPVPVEIGGSA